MGPDESFTPDDRDLLERTFKLARDNNRMLQGMSRAALFNGLFRFLAWALVLGGSIWLYMNYLGPLLESATGALNQAQGAGENASQQLDALRSALDALQGAIPSFTGTTTDQ